MMYSLKALIRRVYILTQNDGLAEVWAGDFDRELGGYIFAVK